MKSSIRFRSFAAAVALVIGAGLSVGAYAQDGGYRVGEGSKAAPPATSQTAPASSDESSGPVRMARVSYVSGNVTWRPDGDTDWTSATDNTPMRQGAQVWVSDGGRAEIQFDDGSVLRLGSGAVATLQTLFSDAQGEFTEIKMTDGLAAMDLRTDHSIYQIDTPHGSIKSVGPSLVRVGVDEDVEVGIREGSATLDGPQGKLTMHAGDYVDVHDDQTSYEVRPLPQADSWDQFTDERHGLLTHVDKNLPENMQYVAGDMENSGDWRDDSQYGKVWAPRESEDWQPYHDGHWVWVDPFGWTWVGDEPWGWVPYHYGSWIHRPWGWGWVPGPICQFWSPAVVSFSYIGDTVCWAPLCPLECVYPSAFDVGFFGPSWGIWFSIGGCGCWFPHGEHECHEERWDNHWVNHWHGWDHDHGHGWDAAAQHGLGGAKWSNIHFTPTNAHWGASASSVSGFVGHGKYVALHGAQAQSIFSKGQTVGAPAHGQPLAGPVKVAQPGIHSWAPSRSGTTRPQENTGIINRPTYRGFGRSGLTRSTNPAPLGEHYSSAASAAAAARQSLGWTPRGGAGGFGSRSNGNFGGSRSDSVSGRSQGGNANRSQNGFGSSRGGTTRGESGYGRSNSGFGRNDSIFGRGGSAAPQGRGGGWTVPDHGGWTHVHSSPPPQGGFGGGSARGGQGSPRGPVGGGGSGGSSRGGGGGNSRGGGHG